ncbi:myelin transcription factor 1-like protein [Stylophora pistillata]|uniref:myelin transcription factor 1-like protein n=1 Tax=Stylophora pistillata TaxID=50429 RepID=UPI000C0493E2|nr:myelin transcription factor 1-like protein [Stylophora pistillata]
MKPLTFQRHKEAECPANSVTCEKCNKDGIPKAKLFQIQYPTMMDLNGNQGQRPFSQIARCTTKAYLDGSDGDEDDDDPNEVNNQDDHDDNDDDADDEDDDDGDDHDDDMDGDDNDDDDDDNDEDDGGDDLDQMEDFLSNTVYVQYEL